MSPGTWRKGSKPGAVVVVLEEERPSSRAREDVLGDPLVAATRHEAVCVVPATDVQRRPNAVVARLEDGVDHPDTVVEQPVWLEALPCEPGSLVLVDQHRQLGCIDLDVIAAEPNERIDLVAEQLRHVLEKGVGRRIRPLERPAGTSSTRTSTETAP